MQVFEKDTIEGNTPVTVNPENAIFSQLPYYNYASSYWVTEWRNDGFLEGNPEYIIKATLVEDPTETITGNGLLHVSRDLPICGGEGDGVHQCITDQNSDVDVSWFATGDQACGYYLGAGCTEVQYECAVLGYDLDLDPVFGWGYDYPCDLYLDNHVSSSYFNCNYRAQCGEVLPCDGVCEAVIPTTYCSDPDCSGVPGINRTCADESVTCSAIMYSEDEIYAGGGNPQILRHLAAAGGCSQSRTYYADQGCVDENTVRMRDAVTGAIKQFECKAGRYCTHTSTSVWSCIDPDTMESLCNGKGFSWDGTDCYGDDCSEI